MRNQRKILILFDFDGTIADSFEEGIKIANSLADKFKYKPLENLEELREKSAVRYIFSKVPIYKIPFWAYLMKKKMLEVVDEIEVYSGIKTLFENLEEEYEFGIISGSKPEYIQKILGKYNLHYFSFIYPNCSTGKHKIIKKIKKKYDCPLVLVGDDSEDIRAAKKSKILSVGVTWGSSSKKRLEQFSPDFIADTTEELENFIRSI
jgi:phosphoglycolate phosphatase